MQLGMTSDKSLRAGTKEDNRVGASRAEEVAPSRKVPTTCYHDRGLRDLTVTTLTLVLALYLALA